MTNNDLLQVVETYGSPVYVYNSEKIASQYKRLTNAFKQVKQLRIHYAVKANSNIAILNILNQLGSGFDIVSGGELARLKAAGAKQTFVFSRTVPAGHLLGTARMGDNPETSVVDRWGRSRV